MSYPHGSNETNTTAVGALAEGFANSAINSTEVDDGSTGYVGGMANGDNRNNTDNSVDLDLKANLELNNGSNRDNSYDWSYDSKSISDNDNISDNDTQIITNTETKVSSDYDWSYDSKSFTHTNTETDTDIKTITDNHSVTDDHTATGSFNSSDTDFAVLEDVKDFGNLGIAGGDLTFNLGDDFSFTLDVDNILNGSLNGEGNESGFSAVQANHLADQDAAWEVRMENSGAENHLSANAGEAHGAIGMDMDGKGWDLKTGDDATGTSTADASAILANSGFHFEFVQGANMLSNAIDSSVIGGDSHTSNVGEDTGH